MARKTKKIKGTSNPDKIEGTNRSDYILGLSGKDYLNGKAGSDTLDGGKGADLLLGGGGNDIYLVDSRRDRTVEKPNQGIDTVKAALGWTLGNHIDNLILTGKKAISGQGNNLNNQITGNNNRNQLRGLGGNDVLDGRGGNDVLSGDDGSDTLLGGNGNDLLNGGTGDDRLFGDAGNDTLEGGVGNDILNGGTENDILKGGLGDDQLTGGLGDDQLFGEDGNDRLLGSEGNDLLDGGIGDDQLAGEAGNDTLTGGIGNDTFTGGSGQDVFVIGTGLGTETIADFRKSEDALQLTSDLTFDNLSIEQGSGGQQNDTIIVDNRTNAVLAILQGVDSRTIDRTDFLGSEISPEVSNTQIITVQPSQVQPLKSPQKISDGIWLLATAGAGWDNPVFSPFNENAANTTNTDQFWSGNNPLSSLKLDGNGLTVGIWDAGYVRNTHQEFKDQNSVSRVTFVGTTPTTFGEDDDHATHVAGTVGADGDNLQAHGMANKVKLLSYNVNPTTVTRLGNAPWQFSDLTALAENAPNIVASNHSYGSPRGWDFINNQNSNFTALPGGDFPIWYGDYAQKEDSKFGKYGDYARQLDEVLYNNPYLLTVQAAGNERNDKYDASNRQDEYSNTYVTFLSSNPNNRNDPNWQVGWYLLKNQGNTSAPPSDAQANAGYDTIPVDTTAKNNLVVGAVDDITPDPYSVSQIKITDFSSWGPTDDGRIKPDVVANGVGLYSPVATSDKAYSSYSGTSMAAPNVTGTAALLIQHYQNLYGSRPLSATTKGLLIHTASDAGSVGPDYRYGWGLVDAAAAANFLTSSKNAQSQAVIRENTLEAAKTENTETFTAITGHPLKVLKVTIAWTDPAGTPHANGTLDQTTPVLVHDLDLSITDSKGQTYYPWTLNPANPSAHAVRTQLNHVDNVEQVVIDDPIPGEKYTVHIGRTGTPFTQNYSLLISEIPKYSPGITLLTDDQKDDLFPQIDGANLVWTQGIGTTGREIWRYNISDGTKLPLSPGNQAAKPTITASNGETFTPTYVDHAGAQISGNRVVWSAGIVETGLNQDRTFQKDQNGKILTTIRRYPYYYDLNSKTGNRLSEDPIVGSPMIKGSHAVWFNADKVVEFYDLNKSPGHLNYAPNAITTQQPSLSDNYAVWVGTNPNTGTDSEIFVYDFNSSQVKQLTDNSTSDLYPHISGSDIVWAGYDGQDYEIFHYNMEHPEKGTQQLTNNTITDTNPKVSRWSNKIGVVWEGGNATNGSEIYCQNIDPITGQKLGSAIQLTANDFYDGKLDVDGSKAVWVGGSAETGNFNLFYRDLANLGGSQTIQLTNQFGQEFPQISGSYIAWDGRPVGAFGAGVKEIFLANTDALTPVVG